MNATFIRLPTEGGQTVQINADEISSYYTADHLIQPITKVQLKNGHTWTVTLTRADFEDRLGKGVPTENRVEDMRERATRYREELSGLRRACLELAAPLAMATDGTTASAIHHIESYVQHLESQVKRLEEGIEPSEAGT